MPDQIESSNENSIFRNITKDDVKLFIITILATVAANIITVIIVALAVIVARGARPTPPTPGNYAINFALSLGPMILLWSAVFPGLRILATHKMPDLFAKVFKWLIVALLVAEGIITMIYILMWIGFAVGIH